MNFIERAKTIIGLERDALNDLANALDDNFTQACERLKTCQGHIIVMGTGKSGHIGRKLAATFASTGSPAFFIHAGEAGHGDFGMITPRDIILALSYSGKTPEVLALLPFIKQAKLTLISITGNANSPLAEQADIHLNIHVNQEACPLGLAPTTSTTVTLALGDALALCLLEAKGFSKEQFALSHPSGHLGKRLLLKVKDVMHTGAAIPSVLETTDLGSSLVEMNAKKLGMTTIVDQDGSLRGVFTDGDLRRALAAKQPIDTNITQLMNKEPKIIAEEELAFHALGLMENHKITTLVVVDATKKVKGIVHLHDLLDRGL